MNWPDFLSKTNPNTLLISIVGLAVVGVDVLPAIFSKNEPTVEQSAVVKELAELKKEKATEKLKKEIMEDLTTSMKKALEPLSEAFNQINKEMQRGSRWSLEMEIDKWIADGEQGIDPKEVHRKAMAEQRLKNISKQEGAAAVP